MTVPLYLCGVIDSFALLHTIAFLMFFPKLGRWNGWRPISTGVDSRLMFFIFVIMPLCHYTQNSEFESTVRVAKPSPSPSVSVTPYLPLCCTSCTPRRKFTCHISRGRVRLKSGGSQVSTGAGLSIDVSRITGHESDRIF
jgi:hypothetical protein